MNFTSSKKTVTILFLIAIILLLTGFGLLYKDIMINGFKNGKWYTLDKHEDMVENCPSEKKGNELIYTCDVLLKNIKNPDKCYSTKILNHPDGQAYRICETDNSIKFQNLDEQEIHLNTMLQTPVKYQIRYTRNYLRPTYTFQDIKISSVEAKELYEDWYKKYDELHDPYLVLEHKFPAPVLYTGLEVGKYDHFGEGGIVKDVYLFDLKLEDIREEEGLVQMNFSGSFNGKTIPYNLNIKSNGFAFFTSPTEEEKDRFLSIPEILNTLKIGKQYGVGLLFPNPEKIDTIQKGPSECTISDAFSKRRQALCNDINGFAERKTTNIEREEDFIKFIKNESSDTEVTDFLVNYIFDLEYSE